MKSTFKTNIVLNEKVHVLVFINYWIENALWNIEKSAK